jgi:WD40 repeat protein
MWDPSSGRATQLGSHGGHATSLVAARASAGGVLSGGQDGVVKLWDARQGGCALQSRVHEGAVNDIIDHPLPNGQSMLLSSGADRTVVVMDPRKGYEASSACSFGK